MQWVDTLRQSSGTSKSLIRKRWLLKQRLQASLSFFFLVGECLAKVEPGAPLFFYCSGHKHFATIFTAPPMTHFGFLVPLCFPYPCLCVCGCGFLSEYTCLIIHNCLHSSSSACAYIPQSSSQSSPVCSACESTNISLAALNGVTFCQPPRGLFSAFLHHSAICVCSLGPKQTITKMLQQRLHSLESYDKCSQVTGRSFTSHYVSSHLSPD